MYDGDASIGLDVFGMYDGDASIGLEGIKVL
jgi:hypothetical protein